LFWIVLTEKIFLLNEIMQFNEKRNESLETCDLLFHIQGKTDKKI